MGPAGRPTLKKNIISLKKNIRLDGRKEGAKEGRKERSAPASANSALTCLLSSHSDTIFLSCLRPSWGGRRCALPPNPPPAFSKSPKQKVALFPFLIKSTICVSCPSNFLQSYQSSCSLPCSNQIFIKSIFREH